jgi:hypothetical protein
MVFVMKKMTLFLMSLLGIVLFSCSNSDSPTTDDYESDLNSIIQSVSNNINSIETNIQNDVQFILQNNDDSITIKEKLKQFLQNNKQVEEYAFINSSGILKYIEPSKYFSFEGFDLSKDLEIKNLMLNKHKVISKIFKAAEGYWANCIMLPVLKNNEFEGAFDCLLKPEVILTEIISKKNCEMWVMEKGGRQIYDYDSTEIGNNLLTDQFSQNNPKLLTAVKLIDSLKTGSSNYEFIDEHSGLLVKKICHWKTYSNYGIEWRFVWVKREN